MRGSAAGFISALTLAFAAGPALAASTMVVPIDQSAAVSLPRGTRDVLIGNPAIADVNVLDPGKAIVLGKGYGVTNMIVVDQLGRTVMERQIVVTAPEGRVSVIRGSKVDDYACAGGCEREQRKAPAGDSAKP
ncbi:pilus assembly protein N-terminal domain-containing protein [Phenylobacterium sp.]|uniref:pilus assembly protein N-terminal domain-containing protein n=1 Tax=Phenylobacterium sp. TaxID=1871053 RepID=UPI0035B0C44A